MYIIDHKRTPIGKFLGGLSSCSAIDLALPLFDHFTQQYPFLKRHTDLVIMGNVLSAGLGMNPARIAAVNGGLAHRTPAFTLNHVCASSLTAIVQAHQAIALGQAEIVLAGGMESMSQAPHIASGLRQAQKMGPIHLIDSLEHDGLFCHLAAQLMGATAENIARKFRISRSDQDKYALQSHRRAVRSQRQGLFDHQIVPLADLTRDEGPRPNTSLAKLSALKPVFSPTGSITAGNASGLNDGAALMLLASASAVKRYKLTPKAKIIAYSFSALDPRFMGLAPRPAITSLLRQVDMDPKDIDLFEINEAFAAQTIAVIDQLGLPPSKVNPLGGAIALGHPLGMTGARILGTLITALRSKNRRRGIAALCVGGGQGVAVLVENMQPPAFPRPIGPEFNSEVPHL